MCSRDFFALKNHSNFPNPIFFSPCIFQCLQEGVGVLPEEPEYHRPELVGVVKLGKAGIVTIEGSGLNQKKISYDTWNWILFLAFQLFKILPSVGRCYFRISPQPCWQRIVDETQHLKAFKLIRAVEEASFKKWFPSQRLSLITPLPLHAPCPLCQSLPRWTPGSPGAASSQWCLRSPSAAIAGAGSCWYPSGPHSGSHSLWWSGPGHLK